MDVRVEPSTQELIGVIALLLREGDSLRRLIGGSEVRFFERTFTRDEIVSGLSLAPSVTVNHVGTVKFHLES